MKKIVMMFTIPITKDIKYVDLKHRANDEYYQDLKKKCITILMISIITFLIFTYGNSKEL